MFVAFIRKIHTYGFCEILRRQCCRLSVLCTVPTVTIFRNVSKEYKIVTSGELSVANGGANF